MSKPLKIWKPQEREPEEPQHFLDLRKSGTGNIELVLVNEVGAKIARGAVLFINPVTHSMTRYTDVNPELSLQLDGTGRVRM